MNQTQTLQIRTNINEREFVHLMLTAAEALTDQSKYLNDINVFPVADGDTGTNMSATLSSLQTDLSLFQQSTYTSLSDRIMNSLLLNSQGNSGTALSQFFKGLLKPIGDCASLDCTTLHQALKSARAEAWKSFDKPVAGTILDVVDALAQTPLPSTENLNEYFEALESNASQAMEKTKKIHPVMKKSHVVDSGAAGLAIVIKSWKDLVDNDFQELPRKSFTYNESMELPSHIEMNDEYQYCTEIVITTESENSTDTVSNTLRYSLEAFGGFIQIVTYRNLLKVHIHTNDPQSVRSEVSQYGEEESFKADDMIVMQNTRMQQNNFSFEQATSKDSFVFMYDSSVDQEPDGSTFPIAYLKIISKEEDVSQTDPDTYYLRMEHEDGFLPRSSKPPEGIMTKMYQDILQANPDKKIIFPTISSHLSATFNAAKKALEDLEPELQSRIYVIDSLLASGGIDMIRKELQSTLKGDESYQEVVDAVASIRDRIKVLFVVDDMEYLRRNGRISKGLSFIGKLLRMSPILTLEDGKIQKQGSPLIFANPSKLVAKLKQQIIQQHKDNEIEQIHILYAGKKVEINAKELEEFARQTVPGSKIVSSPLSTLIGTHTGPGSFGIFFLFR